MTATPPSPIPDVAARSSLPAQLIGAYTASFAKVLAWVVAAAVAYRLCGAGPFAFLMLLRGTLVLFNYTAFGLGPAVSHFVARVTARQNEPLDEPVEAVRVEAETEAEPATAATLDYSPRDEAATELKIAAGETPVSVIWHAFVAGAATTTLALFLLGLYSGNIDWFHTMPRDVLPREFNIAWLLGIGVIARAIGDVAGGAAQVQGRMLLDQLCAAFADLVWAGACAYLFLLGPLAFLDEIARFYLWTGILAATLRWSLLLWINLPTLILPTRRIRLRYRFDLTFLRRLLAFGGLVTLAQLGDFLYAPIDYVILNRLVDPLAVAVYAPAIQIDAAVILLVTALAAVILPRAALRHAADDRAGLWREYLRASVAAGGIAIVAGLGFWIASPWLFQLWLGDPLPATQAILPWVLLHTAIGASAGVGRSTLLAIGKPGVYATSVLLGGLLNIALSLVFVGMGLGLFGVVLGTILSVGVRCLGWMPWYIRRTLRQPPAGAR